MRQAGKQDDTHKKTRARPAKYTQEQKLQAVTVVASMGGVSPASVAEVKNVLGIEISANNLSHWQTQLKAEVVKVEPTISPNDNLDVSKLVADVRRKLMQSHAETLEKISKLQKDDKKLDSASWNQLVLGGAILTDKMLLLAGRSPELDNELTGLQQDCIGTEWEPLILLQTIRKALQKKKEERAQQLLISTPDHDP